MADDIAREGGDQRIAAHHDAARAAEYPTGESERRAEQDQKKADDFFHCDCGGILPYFSPCLASSRQVGNSASGFSEMAETPSASSHSAKSG